MRYLDHCEGFNECGLPSRRSPLFVGGGDPLAQVSCVFPFPSLSPLDDRNRHPKPVLPSYPNTSAPLVLFSLNIGQKSQDRTLSESSESVQRHCAPGPTSLERKRRTEGRWERECTNRPTLSVSGRTWKQREAGEEA